MNSTNIAKIISILLGIPWLGIIVYVLLSKTQLLPHQSNMFLWVFFIFTFLIPTLFFAWEYKHGEISDADITRRSERYKLLTLTVVSNTLALICAYVWGTWILFQLMSGVMLVLLAVYLITFYWKISLHMTFNVVGISLINMTHDWSHMYLYVCIPLVYWSRKLPRKHTTWQLIVGFVVSQGIMLLTAVWAGLA